MPTIETDLGKILERIEAKIDGVAKDVADIKIDLATTKAELKGEINTLRTELKGEIKALDEKLSGTINALGEKTDGLSKRVDSVDFINRGVFVALIIAILGGFAKLFGFIGNNP